LSDAPVKTLTAMTAAGNDAAHPSQRFNVLEERSDMQIRIFVLAAATLAAIALVAFDDADAAERRPFTKAHFEAAQAADASILVDIAASWCPTCKAQRPIVDSLAAEPENRDLVIFEIDFDAQKDAVRVFNARRQSTLIAFRGKTETARSVADTDPASIAALVKTARDR
jgi:thioredoxin 1